MHEFGMVDEFIEKLITQWPAGRKGGTLHVGYGPGLLKEPLTQAFQVHTVGTVLEKVRFEFKKLPISLACPCGKLLSDASCSADMPYAVCPSCQHVNPIPNFNVLEVLHAG
jgi:Zn finger protein HypA/HybF involved in hydrogenase expression